MWYMKEQIITIENINNIFTKNLSEQIYQTPESPDCLFYIVTPSLISHFNSAILTYSFCKYILTTCYILQNVGGRAVGLPSGSSNLLMERNIGLQIIAQNVKRHKEA